MLHRLHEGKLGPLLHRVLQASSVGRQIGQIACPVNRQMILHGLLEFLQIVAIGAGNPTHRLRTTTISWHDGFEEINDFIPQDNVWFFVFHKVRDAFPRH